MRIAGVEVGKVKSVEAEEGTDAAVVVLQINDEGLPLHTDATAKIRPRIFLEGNFFVDLKPGSPEAPELEDGDTIKVTQTATPVQLDEVLTALQSDTRQDLKDLLDGLAVALDLGADGGARTATPTRRRAARPRPSRSTTPTTTSPPPSARPRRCSRRCWASSPSSDIARLIAGPPGPPTA